MSHRTTSGDSPRSHGVDGWRWSFWSLRLGRGSGGGGEIAAAAAVSGLFWTGSGWNTALVISILETTYGFEAFELSAYFGRGSTQRGFRLMLVFAVWENFLRLPCLLEKSSDRAGGMLFIFGGTGLICIGNLMKLIVLVIYFLDCKKQILEMKVDEEVGRKDVGDVDV
ncbi:RS-containing zinc finger protein 21 isoform 1 [Hibiscus syriacus]|uniref:RS-containing zinc finger protein 21 isoform 1 n=1 Tax=Hibiscus syriacus TaxID=106335 RepID=A0A6A2Z7X3_HIBSY|nr:RS-containing zinc finger protein 21 isoform 1 [Hibiscus syriacus]